MARIKTWSITPCIFILPVKPEKMFDLNTAMIAGFIATYGNRVSSFKRTHNLCDSILLYKTLLKLLLEEAGMRMFM